MSRTYKLVTGLCSTVMPAYVRVMCTGVIDAAGDVCHTFGPTTAAPEYIVLYVGYMSQKIYLDPYATGSSLPKGPSAMGEQ